MTYIYPNGLPYTPQPIQPIYVPQPVVIIQQPVYKSNLGDSFSPKTAGKTTSHVVFILDESGSMHAHFNGTVSGFNEFLQTHKRDEEETGIKTYISLYKFNGSSVIQVYNRVPVHEVPELSSENYSPNGSTNLVDAFGAVMQNINNILGTQARGTRDQVIITALTDGGENASKTFTGTDIKKMVQKAEKKNWSFIFLGANIDAFAVSKDWGFSTSNTLQYDTTSMANAMQSAAGMTTRMKSAFYDGQSANMAYQSSAFTDVERSKSNGK